MTRTRQPDAGFTLIEVLVALALFALISGAGFAMLDQVLRTQTMTEGRLDRLAGLQRAMYLLTDDFLQARGRSFTAEAGGPGNGSAGDGGADGGGPDNSGAVIGLRRNAAVADDGSVWLTYRLRDGVLLRIVRRSAGPPIAEQHLISGVTAADWRFFDPQAGWVSDWPPPGQPPGAAPPNPRAVELRVTLTGGAGLRRVALLPRDGG